MELNNKVALIVTAKSEVNLKEFDQENYFIVGVEQGCIDLIQKNVRIDLAISDFDHVSEQELEQIKSYATKVEVLNPEKDLLDGEAAILAVKNLGISKIKFLSKPSSRYDMNLTITSLIKNNDDLEIFNENTLIKKIPAGTNAIAYVESSYLSFYSLFDDNVISLKDFKYETNSLQSNTLQTNMVSNAFLANQNGIVINKKALMMIISK